MRSEFKHAASYEAELVRSAKIGDNTAFLSLVACFDRRVFHIAKQITQSAEAAEEALIETFLKAFAHLDDLRDGAQFHTLLVTIAVDEALKKACDDGRGRSSSDEAIECGEDIVAREASAWQGNPEERHSQEELTHILDHAMQSLEPPYRAVFVLKDIEEFSFEDAAQALNLPVPAVKRRLLRARLQLREELTRRFRSQSGDAVSGQTRNREEFCD